MNVVYTHGFSFPFKFNISPPFVMSGADLSDTDLRSADFSLANVTKVNIFSCSL